jgi:hypothetical protein
MIKIQIIIIIHVFQYVKHGIQSVLFKDPPYLAS